jgi:hypothetical protein
MGYMYIHCIYGVSDRNGGCMNRRSSRSIGCTTRRASRSSRYAILRDVSFILRNVSFILRNVSFRLRNVSVTSQSSRYAPPVHSNVIFPCENRHWPLDCLCNPGVNSQFCRGISSVCVCRRASQRPPAPLWLYKHWLA